MFTVQGSWRINFDDETHLIRAELNANNMLRIHFDEQLIYKGYIPWPQGDIYRFQQGGRDFSLQAFGLFRPAMSLKLFMEGVEVGAGANHPGELVETNEIDVIGEQSAREEIEVIGTEEIPLDNSAGPAELTTEYEVSKTVTNTLSLQTNLEVTGKVGGTLFEVIKAEVTATLAKQRGLEIGQTITQSRRLKFSVPPHKAVVYTIVWKRKVRRGNVLVTVNGNEIAVPYRVQYGLSYEVRSRKYDDTA